MFRSDNNRGNNAVTLLATCLVVLGGAVTCVVISLASETIPQKKELLQRAVLATGGIIVLLWLLRDRAPENQSKLRWSWLARRRRKVAYRAKRRLPEGQRAPAPPGPPTAESIRSITAGQNTWVPSSTA